MAFEIGHLKFGKPEKKEEKGERRDEKREEGKERKPEQEARPLMGVMIALDTYEDIFSDFDTRPFSERGLSDDFLKELLRRTLETPKRELEVLMVMPQTLRKEKDENTIKSRLRKHFSKEVKRIEEKRNGKRRHGYAYFAMGGVLLMLEVYLIEQAESISKFLFAFSQAFILPAGWFLAYTGLEKILQPYGEDAADYEFYKKLQGAAYRFTSYEDLEGDARLELERLEKVAKDARDKAESIARQETAKLEKTEIKFDKKDEKADKPERKEERREEKADKEKAERREEKKDEK